MCCYALRYSHSYSCQLSICSPDASPAFLSALSPHVDAYGLLHMFIYGHNMHCMGIHVLHRVHTMCHVLQLPTDMHSSFANRELTARRMC